MVRHANLLRAKEQKNDEFYTMLPDVVKELKHYKEHFRRKTVYCNCDDPDQSAFWEYFHMNFESLGLRKLISTYYDMEKPAYKTEYFGGNDNDVGSGMKTALEGNGDFRSRECLKLLDEADIVVTNPPFSLFKEYLGTLMENKKKFIIIGNLNAISYKETFHYLKRNEMWLGYGGNCTMTFRMPDHYELKGSAFIGKDGHKYIKTAACTWYTNLDIEKRHESIVLRKKYTKEEYPKYDNYNAINVKRTADIPCDYFGEMGVPISFMNHYNPEQFKIVGLLNGCIGEDCIKASPVYVDEKHKHCICAVLGGKSQYAKIIVKMCNRF